MDVAILMTSYNERERTLACLFDCFSQIDAMKADDTYSFNVYLLDDGSIDGTNEAVSNKFPQVNIIRTEGNLFWSQGMRHIWKIAADKHDYDFYIWIKNKVSLQEGAIAAMLENSNFLRHKAIVVGTSADKNGNIIYGGRTQGNKLIDPDPIIPKPCFTFDGNLVLIPKSVYKSIGNIDPSYRHRFGDRDYGVRAGKKNIPSVVCPGILCICDRNKTIPKWRDSSFPLKQRYNLISSPKGRPLKEQFIYDTRRMDVVRAILHFISLNISILFPIKNNRKTI